MKTLNLEQMGVQEMDAKEIKKTDGWFIYWTVVGMGVNPATPVEALGIYALHYAE